MVLKIIWSPLAIKSYSDNIRYLEKEWSEKEVKNFIASAEKKINFIKEFPEAGFISRKNKYLRKTLIGKCIILIYRYKPDKNKIELVCFFNSWQNPRKMRSL